MDQGDNLGRFIFVNRRYEGGSNRLDDGLDDEFSAHWEGEH